MLQKIFISNLISMVTLIILGLVLSEIMNPFVFISQTWNPKLDTPLVNFWIIYQNNLTIFLNILAGSITFGIFSFLLLCWNSFFFGSGVISLYQSVGSHYIFLNSYIFFEFTALCLFATAAESIGVNLFMHIIGFQIPIKLKKIYILFAYSLLMITLSGIIETLCIYL